MKTAGYKVFYYIILFFPILLLLQGCSSSRRLSDYPNPDRFYERVNNKTKGRTVEIITNSGGIVTAPNGVEARGDSLFLLTEKKSVVPATIPLKLITRIDYMNNDPENTSAFLYTSVGDKIEAYNIKTLPDTMIYDSVSYYYSKTAFATSEINRVKYKSRLMALPAGIITGALAGILISGLTQASNYSDPIPFVSRSGSKYKSSQTIGGAVIGAFIGGLISLAIGFNYNFYFY